MAPSRRAFLAAAAATMAAACSNQATRSDASASTTPTHPVPSTTPTTAGRVGAHATAVTARVTARLRPGSIVSLHTSHTGTITALAPVLTTARVRGLQPVRLQQLLAATPSAP